jgi:hypothetical protein
MARAHLALSLKQPWATLLAHGRKTIEIRRWPTNRRGQILIHAARVPDPRPEAWALVPRELWPNAQLAGGFIGVGELTECVHYRTVETFAADREKHLNDPSWFHGPVMYGFVFANLKALPFRRYPGWMRFFEVEPSAVPSING